MQPFVTKANLACQGAANLCYEFSGKVRTQLTSRFLPFGCRKNKCRPLSVTMPTPPRLELRCSRTLRRIRDPFLRQAEPKSLLRPRCRIGRHCEALCKTSPARFHR
jgi:hypothetical protein